MASSQVRAAPLPLTGQSPLLARRTSAVLSTKRLFYSTERQSPPPEDLQRLFVPLISIDHLSQVFEDLPVDNILALGDQALLHQIALRKFASDKIISELLEETVDEPDVFGPLVNRLYEKLSSYSLKSRGPCEVLLYLSGHGMDPGNICLVPDAMKPHPTRAEHDLTQIEPDKWYKYDDALFADAERYLEEFYCEYANAFREHSKPLGFVGGEVDAHHHGFIGVLGVLGLWCYAHRECKNATYHHLVIVADCCFAGIWGATLERILKSDSKHLHDYKDCLFNYPVSIQCATYESEASNAGLFTPLWYFLQDATQSDLDRLQASPKRERDVTQHPWYVSTSPIRPSWKFFNDSTLFVDLHGAQLKQLEEYVLPAVVREDNCPPLVWPFIKALNSEAKQLRDKLEVQLRAVQILERAADELRLSHASIVDQSIKAIKQSYDCLRDLVFNAIPRSQRPLRHFVLDQPGNKLSKANREQLKKTVQPRDQEHVIRHGVYVFQGGEGDMSLIVTPGQKQVILIDGAKTADCFEAAWNSILKYLTRITMIFVTHHDEDHTFGIQLLLARYWVEPPDMLPDISRTIIYMNTRSDFLRKNFKHEKEIEALANKLGLLVEPFIINRHCLCVDLHMEKDFFLAVLLPRQQLVDECRGKVPEVGLSTGPVSSRGRTTAANVLSINVVAVWKKRDAYLFTGDAHLKDVTQAAQDFLHIHPMKFFKYVDVPHHGSAHSNVTNVGDRDRGLAGIPAENYLISHCGNHQNPSFQTVKDILKREDCRYLYFLYKERNSTPPVKKPPVPKSEKEPTVPKSGKEPTVPKSGKEPTVPKSEKEPTVPKSEKEPTVPKSEKEPTVPKSEKEPTVPKSEKEPTVPKSGKEPTVPKSGKEPTVPKSEKEPTVSKSEKEPTVPKSEKEPMVPKSEKEPTVPKSEKEPTVPKSEKEPTVPKSEKEPTVPKSGKKPSRKRKASKPPGISCEECKVGHETTTRNWHCACVRKEEVEAKIRFPDDQECFVFFPFTD